MSIPTTPIFSVKTRTEKCWSSPSSSTSWSNSMPPQVNRTGRGPDLDRFIPQRSALRPDQSRFLLEHCAGEGVNNAAHAKEYMDIFSQATCDPRHTEYRRRLGEVLFGRDFDESRRVLPVVAGGRGGVGGVGGEVTSPSHQGKYWPVKPRQGPRIGKPVAVLDLPNVSDSLYSQQIEWGSAGVLGGILAASSGHRIYLWRRGASTASSLSPPENVAEQLGDIDPDKALALSWCPDYHILAVGTKSGFLQLWNCLLKKMEASRMSVDRSHVGAIAWHPFDQLIVIGTWRGNLSVYTVSLACSLKKRATNYGRISCLSFNGDGTLLASGGEDGLVQLWAWQVGALDRVMCFDGRATVTGLSWHPWRSSMLVAGSLLGQLSVMNLASLQTVQATYACEREAVVTALSFAPHTGELVAAFRARSDEGPRQTHVLVLADFTTVVDRLDAHQSVVNYVQWSPDGAIAATAGADETLCLWNFMGEAVTKRLGREAEQAGRKAREQPHFGCIIR